MLTKKCTHPAYTLIFDLPLSAEQADHLQAAIRARHKDLEPIVTGMGGRVEVIECSWCRNPDAE